MANERMANNRPDSPFANSSLSLRNFSKVKIMPFGSIAAQAVFYFLHQEKLTN